MDSTLRRYTAWIALLAAFAAAPALAYNHTDTVSPVTLGPFNVACSNVAQDASRIAPGATAPDYWEGRDHYVTELLTAPSTAVIFGVRVPDDSMYPGNRGQMVDFAAIVCYPTPANNNDPGYMLPGTNDIVPHMQPAGVPPKLISIADYLLPFVGGFPEGGPGPPMRMPLVLFSHGLTGSPISKGYITALVALASHGYMVAAPFHGDPRFSRVRIEDLSDFAYLLLNFDHVVEMQLMRPLSLKSMIDYLLANPDYAAGIDATRIGGFGASLGGEAMLHLLGARITGTVGRSCRDAPTDPRVKAAVGFVPYAGQTFMPAFCDGQSGAASVDRPFLALSGTIDTTAPIAAMDDTIHQMKGSRYLVAMQGVPHQFIPEYAGDMFTWAVTFINAYLQVPWDTTAMARFIRMKGVAGGPSDNLIYDEHVPFAAATAGERPVREFHNTILDHYFLAADPGEVLFIQQGGAGPGWELTGESFKAFAQMPTDTLTNVAPVCRFYGGVNGGPNSHFFTAVAGECDWVKAGNAGPWYYEGTGFYIEPAPQTQRCPDGLIGVNRAYNNGSARNDSNHRFTTSDSTTREMQSRGWVNEGLMMCARP